MVRFLSWILIIPLGAAVVAFTVSNRGRVIIDLWPAPFSFETPIFAAVLVAIFIGFLLGGFVSFISASRGLLRNRQLSKALENAKREELILKNEVRKFELAAADQSPRSKIQL